MNCKLLLGILIFSFSLMTQKAMAMDTPEWWGAEIEGHKSIRISAPGKELLLVDLPSTTGLTGTISAPVIVIENFPEDQEDCLSSLLKSDLATF